MAGAAPAARHPVAGGARWTPVAALPVLPLPLQRHYDGARFDWWALDYAKGKRPRPRGLGIGAARRWLLPGDGGWPCAPAARVSQVAAAGNYVKYNYL